MTHLPKNGALLPSRNAPAFEEITTAVKEVFDAWMGAASSMPGNPIDEYIDDAVWYLSHAEQPGHDKATDENLAIVGTDGLAWSGAQAYESARRTGEHCSACPYYGYCPGRFVAVANRLQQQLLARSGCPVRKMVSHIVVRLQPARVSRNGLRTPGRTIQNQPLRISA